MSFADPYQWLEDDEADTRVWQRAQDALTIRRLRTWPHYGRTRELIRRLQGNAPVAAPERHGSHWYWSAPDRSGAPTYWMSDRAFSCGRRVFDPKALTDDGALDLDWVAPSPDGQLVACGVSRRGDWATQLRIAHVGTSEVLPDRVPHSPVHTFAWFRDSSGFLYGAPSGRDAAIESLAIFEHRIGRPANPNPQLDDLRHPVAFPHVSADGRYAWVSVGNVESRPDYIRDLRAETGWRPFLRDATGMFTGTIVGDEFVAITTYDAPRGRLVAIRLDDPNRVRELIPESESSMRDVVAVGDRLVLCELQDTHARLRIVTMAGEAQPIQLPGLGAVEADALGVSVMGMMDMVRAGEHEILFVYSTFTQSPAVYRYDLSTDSLEAMTQPSVRLDGVVTRLEFATSSDGTAIPFHLVHRADLDPHTPHTTLIRGYGGFNVAQLPAFAASQACFVAAGGIFVLAHLRGGGEYGRDWWQSGRMHCKQNTFDDLYAVAEHLMTAGFTTPDRLALMGVSNGGTLAGVAITQRPDLFRAVVSRVPLLDLLRVVRDPVSMVPMLSEYGDPNDPSDARVLASWSPYQNVREGVSYPACLFTAGENDPRCPPWHIRKMAARLQHATTGERPILMHVYPDTGHMTRFGDDAVAQETDALAFVMSELGMEPSDADPFTKPVRP